MLPSEILLTIFKYLKLQDITNCSSVSHFFHEISMDNNLRYLLVNKYFPSVLDQYYFDITYHNSINYYDTHKILITHTDFLNRAFNLNSICNIDKLVVPRTINRDSKHIFQHITNLIHIDLSVSLIHENINMFCLTNMKKLRYVDISSNRLHAVPSIICLLDTLEVLDISNNYLINLPEIFLRLVCLKILNLSNNMLISFPNCIHKLNLIYINLSYNNFRILPQNLKIETVRFDLF